MRSGRRFVFPNVRSVILPNQLTFRQIAIAALFSSLSLFASANDAVADIQCVRIGADPFGQSEQIIISGDQGAYSYVAYDGEREFLTDLQCSNLRIGAVCQRVHDHDDGLSVSHYFLQKREGLSKLISTNFSQNSDLSGQSHYAGANEFLVECADR